MRSTSLFIPGLFEALPTAGAPCLQPNALLTLLARARQSNTEKHASDDYLLQLFGLETAPSADAPMAALSRLGELEDAPVSEGYWLRADPVHLRADQARLLLFGPRVLAVRMEEAQALAVAFNGLYGDVGWRLETPHPQRWYLHLPDDPQIRTHALHRVIGRNIDSFLPGGINGKHWHAVLNEVQMLFHGDRVNTSREERGELAINSVWFWGGGTLPVVSPLSWTQLCSTDSCARGLAAATGVATVDRAEITAGWTQAGAATEQLVVIPELQDTVSYGDTDSWRAQLMALEDDWFAPALTALQTGRLDALRLYPGDNRCYQVNRADLRRFWRRRRTFESYQAGR